MINKTNLFCVLGIIALGICAYLGVISKKEAAAAGAYLLLQIFKRDTQRKIEKASKNPNVTIQEDLSKYSTIRR